ncbi:MAG: AAA family ATPase [Armatimonadetes bacterium]|nr:AAA family ATPase [Armatimonadota bacterium]
MSVWIANLRRSLERYPVVILHGNVRDCYIDEHGGVYENLTALLRQVAQELTLRFSEVIFYDAADHERREGQSAPPPPPPADDELAGTAPERSRERLAEREPPVRTLSRWARELTQRNSSRFITLFYLDKLIAYRQGGYSEDEKQIILRLEKLIENITPNHRLVMVSLQDTMVPLELYIASPKTAVLPIPMPSKADRMAYLRRRLGQEHVHLELIADLTDGLFLRDLDNIASEVRNAPELSAREVRRLVNKYRLGEQEDYWGQLSIEKLNGALRWFTEQEGVKGQDEALRRVVEMLILARAGLSGVASGTASKPRGVLFFAGPTGVGKTFVAKKLAKFLFGTEEAFLRFDMSEFKEEHTVSKFIGSPPGYVGYEKGGMLTNAVRERPFAVILFDEIEKAHPRIMDIFLQILDEGRLTDSRGQTVFFTETVIIFTSNIGTRTTDSRGEPISERDDLEAIIQEESDLDQKKQRIREHFARAVERFFMFEISRPELLNRIGNNIVPFNYIQTPEVQAQIVLSHLQRIREEVEDRYRTAGYRVEFDDSIAEWLVQRHGEKMTLFGGRGITNAIEDEVMKPLARAILRAEYQNRQRLRFRLCIEGGGIKVEEI